MDLAEELPNLLLDSQPTSAFTNTICATMRQRKIPTFCFVVGSQPMRSIAKVSFLALFVMNPTPVKAECGMNKPFKIYVQGSYHASNVALPMAGCKTKDSPCTTSGTVFIVSAKKVRYAILLLNGIEGKLELGESYSAFLLCQKSPMMIPENKDGKPIAAFYVLGQQAQPREAQIHFHVRTPIVSKRFSRCAFEE